jgi:hypothetical protein
MMVEAASVVSKTHPYRVPANVGHDRLEGRA